MQRIKRKTQNLKNKRILITAGPTWVNIDNVRVISNIATGETGILLSKEAKSQGARVSLLLGPVNDCRLDRSVRILRFKFFDELKNILVKELRTKRYDALIHTAAVSDYRPRKIFKNKINSGLRQFSLKLVPTIKIADLIKKIDNSVLAIAFKFEPNARVNRLISRAKTLFASAHMDLVVANSISNRHYRAYILSNGEVTGPIPSKERLAKELIKKIGGYFGGDSIR